ncbi:MAG: hypothetical protein ACR2QE_07760 [Acidimicrobiales bacterium]
MRTWRFLAFGLTAAIFIAVVAGGPARAQTESTTTTDPTTTLSADAATTTTASGPVCPDADLIDVAVVFTGMPSDTDNDTLVFEDVVVESGRARPPVIVNYPDGLPVLADVDALRVRAVRTNTGLESEVECGGTTTIDDELLEVDDDRLAALVRTAGDLSSRAGRWALIISLGLFAAVAAITLFRRWRPGLW